jgi:hypothetical protein
VWLNDVRSIVRAGEIIDLGQTLTVDTPHHPNHPPFMFRLTKEHGDVVYGGGVSAANDMFSMGTHIGTHIDGLGHIAQNGTVCGRKGLEGHGRRVPVLREENQVNRPRIFPECGHVFRGNGWDGIDAHWRAKHERVMRYEDFWSSLCDVHRL